MSFQQTLTVEIIKIIPFLIIGGITAYIAYRQYVIEKEKHQLRRRDEMLDIYRSINSVCLKIAADQKIDNKTFEIFTNSIAIRKLILSNKTNELINRMEDLIIDHNEYDGKQPESNFTKAQLFDMIPEIFQEIFDIAQKSIK